MSSVQERLQLKRKALDKWSIREKLCLASAVSSSGDQNWMSVSRSLKVLCNNSNRPPDWFSQKSCAVQYGDLLENAENPKRKKRTSERDYSYVTETPTESILRKLTQERIAELKALVQQEQEDYAKYCEELIAIKGGKDSDQKIREIWKKIEQEQEQKVLEKQKHAQWLKEREERKLALQQAWLPGQFHLKQVPQQLNLSSTKQVDMDIDETCSRPQGTSPLLSSLLNSTSPAPTVSIASTNVRVTAPTITNLLTGSTPATTASIAAVATPQELTSLQLKPLTGPNPQDAGTTQSILPSPSQSAPTLSMLLESTKNPNEKAQSPESTKPTSSQTVEATNKTSVSESWSPNRDDERQLLEVFKGLIPDNIEEFDEILNETNSIILAPELLEEDKSILDGVESLIEDAEKELETKINEEESKIVSNSKNQSGSPVVASSDEKDLVENKKDIIPEIPIEIENSSKTVENATSIKKTLVEYNDSDNDSQMEYSELITEESIVNITKEIIFEDKSEVNSSDESSENTNLQALKEKIEKIKEEPKTKVAEQKESETEKETILPKIEDDMTLNMIIKSIIHDFKPEIKRDEGDINKDKEIDITIVEDNQIAPIEKIDEHVEEKPEDVQILVESEEIAIVVVPSDDNSNTKSVKEELTKENPELEASPRTAKEFLKDKKVEIVITDTEEKVIKEKVVKEKTTKERNVREEIVIPLIKLTTPELSPKNVDTSEAQPTLTTMDTDEEFIKEEIPVKEKRDYSRRKSSVLDKKVEEVKVNLTVKKLREADGSESPVVEEDLNDSTTMRTRRRYSSTPVLDSIPNSPASIDDRDSKAWRKSLLTYYTRLLSSKNAQIFPPTQSEEQLQEYRKLCYRWVDWPIIKKSIETGQIRTTIEFQRDIMLMCHNAMMIFARGSANFIMAKDLIAECSQCIDVNFNDTKRETEKEKVPTTSSNVKVRGSSRKSLRLP